MMIKKLFTAILTAGTVMFTSSVPVLASDSSVDVSISVTSSLTGDVSEENATFDYILEPEGNAPMPEIDTISISGNGTGSFSEIKYTVPETYHYKIYEVKGNSDNITYDSAVYNVSVYVTSGSSGNLEAAVCAFKDDSNLKSDEIVFTNHYSEPDAEEPEIPDDSDNTSGDAAEIPGNSDNTSEEVSETPVNSDQTPERENEQLLPSTGVYEYIGIWMGMFVVSLVGVAVFCKQAGAEK